MRHRAHHKTIKTAFGRNPARLLGKTGFVGRHHPPHHRAIISRHAHTHTSHLIIGGGPAPRQASAAEGLVVKYACTRYSLLRDCHVDYARESRRAMRCLISNNRFFSDCTAVCAIEYNARTCVRGRVEVLLCTAAGALPAGWCSPCCRRGWLFFVCVCS